jgi:hypothetical protein
LQIDDLFLPIDAFLNFDALRGFAYFVYASFNPIVIGPSTAWKFCR